MPTLLRNAPIRLVIASNSAGQDNMAVGAGVVYRDRSRRSVCKEAETSWCNDEHVDRNNVGQVVVQDTTPGQGGDLGPPRHVSSDGGLADLDAELEQFAVDAGAPQSGLASLIRRIRSRISVLI